MKKAVITLIVIGVVAGTGYGAYRMGYLQKYAGKYLGKVIPALAVEETEGDGRVSSDSEDAVPVDSVRVVANLGSGNGMIEKFAGEIEPQEEKKYSAESGRTIDKTYVEEGDSVKKGDKLFSYDVDEMKDKLEQAEIDLERMQNEIDVSEAKQKELEKQLEKASTPEKKLEVLSEQNTLKQNKLELKSKESKISSIKEQISNSTVYSDIDGVVKSVNKNAGSDSSDTDYSGSGDSSAYITLLKVGTYRVKASCNEQNIASVYVGERVLVHSRVDSSITWTGTVTEIKKDQGSDSQSSGYGYMGYDTGSGSTNYPFYVELDDSHDLMLGQHVYLEEDLGQEDHRDGIWIDSYYIVEEDGGSYVWAASEDNKLEKRKVETGESDEDEDKVQIVSGLSEDDYIAYPDGCQEGAPVSYNDENTIADAGDQYLYEETEGVYRDLSELGIPGLDSAMMAELNGETGYYGDDYADEGDDYGYESEEMIPLDESEE